MKLCSLAGCDRRHYGRGYCSLHHRRWAKWGNPRALRKRTRGKAWVTDGIGYIELTRGLVATVDVSDLPALSSHCWYAGKRGQNKWYAIRRIGKLDGRDIFEYMHRALLVPEAGLEVDHINGDGLNNRRSNLRVCTHVQNGANKEKRSGFTSRYKGVSRLAPHREKQWHSRIYYNRRVVLLGNYRTERGAAIAYNIAARLLHGEFARLNKV